MELVREGRKAEMQGFHATGVYEVRPRSEATSKGARVVGVRWVDTLICWCAVGLYARIITMINCALTKCLLLHQHWLRVVGCAAAWQVKADMAWGNLDLWRLTSARPSSTAS